MLFAWFKSSGSTAKFIQWKRPTRGSGLAQGSMEKKQKNRVRQQTLKKRTHKADVSITGHLIHIIFQSCKISLILSEVDIHSSTPRTHSAHYKISSVSPHTDGPGSWASQIRETGGRGTERVMENREKARKERTHSIYAARYELKRYEKIYCLGQRSSYLWPSVTDRNCALENINNDHIDLQTTVPMANEQ